MTKQKKTTIKEISTDRKPKVVGYTRVSTDKQTLQNQQFAIYDYCKSQNINTSDKETFRFVDITISSRKSIDERKVWEALKDLQKGDSIIVAELSRLGRSTLEILTIWKEIADKGINLTILDNKFLTLDQSDDENSKWMKGMMITFISQFAELERKLVSQRTSIALEARKAKGLSLGKKVGTIQKTMYDDKVDEIIYYLSKGISFDKIAALIHVGKKQSLFKFVKSRDLESKARKIDKDMTLEKYLSECKKKRSLESKK